jgi:hypothetical protein
VIGDVMDDESSQLFSGNAGKAMDLAVQILASSGFRIISRSGSSLEVEGPGVVCNRQRSISAVSRAWLRITRGSITLSADFKSLHKLSTTLAALLIGLCLLLLIIFNALLPIMHWSRPVTHPRLLINLICIAPFVPWIFLMPTIMRVTRRRMVRELDTFLHNVAVGS